MVKVVDNVWSTYTMENSVLPDNSIYAIAIGKNDVVWLGIGRKLVEINGPTWTVYDPPNSNESMVNQEQSILIDKDENIWMARIDAGIVKYDGESWTLYNMSNSDLPDENIYTLAQDSSGDIWIGSNAGLTKFNGEDEWITYNPSNSGLPSKIVWSIFVDKYDHLWIGTHGGGLAYYDKINWKVYNTMNSGLSSNVVQELIKDTFENLWIGAYQGGLAAFHEGGIINNIKDDKYLNSIYNFELMKNYPNPFNSSTVINYKISKASKVVLKIYDYLGKELTTLVNSVQSPGKHSIRFNADHLSTGVYIYSLNISGKRLNGKMILMK